MDDLVDLELEAIERILARSRATRSQTNQKRGNRDLEAALRYRKEGLEEQAWFYGAG
jgi:hypothetical protein